MRRHDRHDRPERACTVRTRRATRCLTTSDEQRPSPIRRQQGRHERYDGTSRPGKRFTLIPAAPVRAAERGPDDDRSPDGQGPEDAHGVLRRRGVDRLLRTAATELRGPRVRLLRAAAHSADRPAGSSCCPAPPGRRSERPPAPRPDAGSPPGTSTAGHGGGAAGPRGVPGTDPGRRRRDGRPRSRPRAQHAPPSRSVRLRSRSRNRCSCPEGTSSSARPRKRRSSAVWTCTMAMPSAAWNSRTVRS